MPGLTPIDQWLHDVQQKIWEHMKQKPEMQAYYRLIGIDPASDEPPFTINYRPR